MGEFEVMGKWLNVLKHIEGMVRIARDYTGKLDPFFGASVTQRLKSTMKELKGVYTGDEALWADLENRVARLMGAIQGGVLGDLNSVDHCLKETKQCSDLILEPKEGLWSPRSQIAPLAEGQSYSMSTSRERRGRSLSASGAKGVLHSKVVPLESDKWKCEFCKGINVSEFNFCQNCHMLATNTVKTIPTPRDRIPTPRQTPRDKK
eukprot:TRINITY_DN22341_c0_g1_i1.p1 TRINITY_DN22341_c0_g1~~TRINITY_DN22341_c0_g1_i1.p1  ORF type:complete len:206 (-),score=43.06 TRINITY_DN22341_c0_g1_i1:37-654(-)